MTSPEVQALLDKARENVRAAEVLRREFAKTQLLDPHFHRPGCWPKFPPTWT